MSKVIKNRREIYAKIVGMKGRDRNDKTIQQRKEFFDC